MQHKARRYELDLTRYVLLERALCGALCIALVLFAAFVVAQLWFACFLVAVCAGGILPWVWTSLQKRKAWKEWALRAINRRINEKTQQGLRTTA
jgi:fatty acid desaturase